MRTITLTFLFITLLSASNIQAQKIYSSNQFKLIFSTAPNLSRGGQSIASPIRFTAFFNYSTFLNLDLTKNLGLSIGLEVKNIGLITKDSIFRTKHRAYAIGVPIYLRIGNMDKRWYFLAGAQYDYLFAYKEKVFVNDAKIKRHGYNNVTPFIPSVFLGFRSKSGTSISVHYMLRNFFSTDYRFKDPTQDNAPFSQGYNNSQLLYFTIGFMGDLDKKKAKKAAPDPESQEVYSRNH
ncbi:MAG: hypothetical protein JWO58_107 [Chitinophagaceae bacterium]|nr:hypothetical protein [Chitinophagaceae bacterium]